MAGGKQPSMPIELPTAEGIFEAERCIRPRLQETPLIRSLLLSRALDADVWLKLEIASPISSFKLRGALTAISRAQSNGSPSLACTSSTGNHGQGVAYAAQMLGLHAEIFLPVNPNPVKRGMIEALGARIHEVGEDLDETKEIAKRYAEARDGIFVDDGESLDLMEGAGTIGLECARALPGIDVLFAPMGSGTLAVGTAVAAKRLQPQMQVIAIQAKGSPAMVESFHLRRSVTRPIDTIADGLTCRVPAARALAGLLAFVDDAMAVEESNLLASVNSMLECAHLLTEPAAAAALAGAWERRDSLSGKRVVLIVTGANIPADQLHAALKGPALVKLGPRS